MVIWSLEKFQIWCDENTRNFQTHSLLLLLMYFCCIIFWTSQGPLIFHLFKKREKSYLEECLRSIVRLRSPCDLDILTSCHLRSSNRRPLGLEISDSPAPKLIWTWKIHNWLVSLLTQSFCYWHIGIYSSLHLLKAKLHSSKYPNLVHSWVNIATWKDTIHVTSLLS